MLKKKKKDNGNEELNAQNNGNRTGNHSQAGNDNSQTGSQRTDGDETAAAQGNAAGQTGSDNGPADNDNGPVDNGDGPADNGDGPVDNGDGPVAGGETPAQSSAEDSLREELAALNDKYLRLFAEFDNFKRRSSRERVELIGSASKNVILALLPVLDDFDRAQKSMETAKDAGAVREGIDLIIAKFRNILSQQGVREMDAVGEPFDADLHEAVTSIPAPSEDLKGKVVDQLEKGYYLNDKVIRFAKVLVGA